MFYSIIIEGPIFYYLWFLYKIIIIHEGKLEHDDWWVETLYNFLVE